MTPITTHSRGDFSLVRDRRDTPRIRAHLCATISSNGTQIHASGTVLDLAVMGCQIELETSCSIKQSALLEVRIYVPDLGWTIIIEEAVVQWVTANRLGLSFVSVRLPEGDSSRSDGVTRSLMRSGTSPEF
jgi:hypothetical protein